MLVLKENILLRDGRSAVTIAETSQISTWGMHKKVRVEAPVYLGLSQIETGFIGAFTFVNRHAVNCAATTAIVECQSIGRFGMIAHGVNIGMGGHPSSFLRACPHRLKIYAEEYEDEK